MLTNMVERWPLHEACKIGAPKHLKGLLDKNDVNPASVDFKKRTPLHYAAACAHHRKSYECVKVLLTCENIANLPLEKKREYIDSADINGETALHLAAKNEAKKTVEFLILDGADVNIKSNDGKEQLDLIYSKIPDAMIEILNRFAEGLQVFEMNPQKYLISPLKVWSGEASDEDLVVRLDFGVLIGHPEANDPKDAKGLPIKLSKETEMLSYALGAEKSAYKEVLVHPLVKMFLELKWKKVRLFFFLAIVFHVIWLLLLTTFVTQLYKVHCPYNPEKNMTEEDDETNFPESGGGYATNCNLRGFNKITPGLLLTTSGIVLIKEIFQMCSVPKLLIYFGSLENLGQLTMIISTFVVAWPILSFSTVIYPWLYQVAAFTIFLAWTLILTQIGKMPSLEVYVLILARVLKSFSLFIFTFSSLLIAFALALSIIFPGREEFDSFPTAFLRVIIMMTGELDYMDTFHGEGSKPDFPVSANLIYAFFTIGITIILCNLLIGITINDIQGLQAHAEISRLSGKLKRIYLLESFLVSDQLQLFMGWFKKRHLLEKFLIIPPSTSIDDFSLNFPIHELPKDIQKEVRDLAALNSVCDPDE